MSGMLSPKACRMIPVVPMALGIAVIVLALYICDTQAADIENTASYQSPEIQLDETVNSQELPGGPLMFYATISTIVASFAALMLAVITFAHLAKTNKRISQIQTNPSAISQQQKLTEAIDLISAIEYRLDGLEKRIDSRLGQWDQYEARLNAAEAQTEKTGRQLSRNYTDLQQATARLDAIAQDIEALKVFKETIKSIRDRIVDAFGQSQTNMQQDSHPVTDVQADEAEENSTASDEPKDKTAEADNSGEESASDMMKYYYPGRSGSEFSE